MGIKPLHYAITDDGFLYFASEMKSLYAVGGLEQELDPSAVEDYFTFGYVPDPKSIYTGIRKLAPGCWLKQARSKPVQTHRYWDIRLDQEAQAPLNGWREELVDEMEAAVKRRLVADVPLGAFLSGGIDSSAVVAMMRRTGAEDILTCSIGFDEPRYDESRYADMVSETHWYRAQIGASASRRLQLAQLAGPNIRRTLRGQLGDAYL